jgi:hypothetical protein
MSYAEGIVAVVWNYEISPLGQDDAMLLLSIEFFEGNGLMGLLKRLLRPVTRIMISHNLHSLRRWAEHRDIPDY